MQEVLFSPSWYRVASLKPRLRGHTRVYRHEYRGELWYVLQDHAKGRYYRFTPTVYQFLGKMNGKRSVEDIWESTTGQLGDDAPTQGEIVHLLSQLHTSDVLLCNVPPDTDELLRRAQKLETAKWKQRISSPLAIRIPLLDPDRFLSLTAPLVTPLFGVFGALVWLAVVLSAIVLAGLHWPELTGNIVDRVFSAENLLAIGIAYPLVKVLHELGHGYAVKAWGGEVHEMGIMFLVFMPIPYVDASASSEFRSKHRRMVVGSAGIIVEMFLAATAMFLWVGLEQGLMRALAFNVILIGSVSTVLFNGNPLLRYDGYYILADLLDIPNLGQRGQRYFSFLVGRTLGNKNADPPHAARGERFWFVLYTVLAFFYRIFIYVLITLLVAGKFFIIGIILALWVTFNRLCVPLYKGVNFLLNSPTLRDSRPRAIALTLAALAVLGVLLFVVPLPLRTRAEGVVWVPEEGLVRAAAAGFISDIAVEPDANVTTGELLMSCRDPLLLANVQVLRARLAEVKTRYDAARATDRVQVRLLQEELDGARAELERAEEKVSDLDIFSPRSGLLVMPNAGDLPGRFLRKGDLVGFVLDVEQTIIRAVVPQSKVDLVRQRTGAVKVRLAESLEEIRGGVIDREMPGAAEYLPSPILGSAGGGEITIDPSDPAGTKTFEKMFQFDIRLDQPLDRAFIGGRAYIRFDHGYEPLGIQIYRRIRQLFLQRFNV